MQKNANLEWKQTYTLKSSHQDIIKSIPNDTKDDPEVKKDGDELILTDRPGLTWQTNARIGVLNTGNGKGRIGSPDVNVVDSNREALNTLLKNKDTEFLFKFRFKTELMCDGKKKGAWHWGFDLSYKPGVGELKSSMDPIEPQWKE